MKTLTRLTPPVSASDCADQDGNAGWASRVLFSRPELRAGQDLSIEAKSQRADVWIAVMLPGTGTQFASAEDRDTVLAWARGEVEIPNLITAKTP